VVKSEFVRGLNEKLPDSHLDDVESAVKINLKILDRLCIHTGATSICLNTLVGFPNDLLGNIKRLCLFQMNPPITGCTFY
jgi:hypothetical protein